MGKVMTDMNGTDNMKRLRLGAVPGRVQLGARATAQPAQPGRRAAGFTLMETMLVVGITAVLLGLAFVGIMQMWKNLQQTELDATAKEVYVAAQNHLSLAESQGLLESGSGISLGTRESLDASAGQDDVYFFVHSPSASADSANSPDNKASALNLMLPFGAIDETVRAGGSYVIRYQPSTATVIDVFYAKDVDFSETVVSGLDAQSLESAYGGDNREARQDYRNTGKIIGYYGAEPEGEAALKLKAPTLQVINGDTLQVKVTNPNNSGHEYEVKLVVESESKTAYAAAIWFDEADARVSGNTYTFTLDDVTKEAGRFYRVAESRDADHKKANASMFVPGENLRIYAWVAAKDTTSVVAKSATATTNSLFADALNAHKASEGASLSPAEALATGGVATFGTAAADTAAGTAAADGPQGRTVEIVTFRHLANLSSPVSHFNYQAVRDSQGRITSLNPVANEYGFVTAVQKTDMDWNGFMESEHAAASMWRDGAVASKQGTFLPVEPGYVLTYDGGGYSIENIAVDVEGSAGVFATLGMSGSAVSGLTLVDSSVTSSGGAAGGLAGEVGAGVEVSNVLARDGLAGPDASAQVTGATAAGGLVGLLNGGTVRESAAAVYVSATGGSGAAGGLVGAAQNGAVICDSYSGGHTSGGVYLATTSGAARLNVMSGGVAAGGLVGSASDSAISSCYSTCSVRGAVSTGGFVGVAQGGSIANSYSVGAVSGVGKGGFAGSVSGTALDGDRYLAIVNKGMGSGANAAGVTQIDADTSAYRSFISREGDDGGAGNAVPYDRALVSSYNRTLAQAYQGKFLFETIAELSDSPLSDDSGKLITHLHTHYGDWPAPETLVPNSR